MAGQVVWAGRTARVSMGCCVRAQTALTARPRSARLRTLPRVLLLERLCQSLRCAPEAEPTTCFKIREVLGVSMCTKKLTEYVSRCGWVRSDEEISYQLRGKLGKSRDEDVDDIVPGTQVGEVD